MKETTRIFRFVVIGTLNALITAATIGLAMGVLGIHYLASNVAAYVLAQTNNFLWCKYWIFPTASSSRWSNCWAATSTWPSSSASSSTARSIS